jgi:hypothetical protein
VTFRPDFIIRVTTRSGRQVTMFVEAKYGAGKLTANQKVGYEQAGK